jgi:putative MFS transporter
MYFTPGPNSWVAGWLFLSVMRFFVGTGNAGLYAVDLPLIQEFMPASKRGWVSALVTTLLPAGSLLGALVGAYLAPIIGWRGLFLIGLLPISLVLIVRYWVPESPRWLIQSGRHEEARRSLAWALQVDPKEIDLPAFLPEAEKTRWRELFRYPRSIAAGCLTGLTQTGIVGPALWGATLFTLVLGVSPARAAFLYIWVSVAAVVSRFGVTLLIEPLGRRGLGILCCVGGAVATVLAGYLYDAYIGGVSLFYVLFIAMAFFGSAMYSVVGPYMAEIWPTRLRVSGMGLAYGTGNFGKVISPLGLALIIGAGDLIKPAANLKSLELAFSYFAFWYVLGALAFWLIGIETKGRTFEEMDSTLGRSALIPSVGRN